METKRSYKSFSYEDNVTWKSARRGVVRAAGKPDLEVSSPPNSKAKRAFGPPKTYSSAP